MNQNRQSLKFGEHPQRASFTQHLSEKYSFHKSFNGCNHKATTIQQDPSNTSIAKDSRFQN